MAVLQVSVAHSLSALVLLLRVAVVVLRLGLGLLQAPLLVRYRLALVLVTRPPAAILHSLVARQAPSAVSEVLQA